MDLKQELIKNLEKQLNKKITLEIPPNTDFGDYALQTFKISKKPNELQKELKLPNFIEKTEIKGPYLNFFIKKDILNKIIIENISKKPKKQNKKITIEFPSPNTNKPLHLGHIRNIVIGQSLANILKYTGNEVIQVNLLNDRGVHICKSMIAYQKLSKTKEPNKKSDHFIGDLYVLFSKKAKENIKLEEEAQNMLQKWENKDKQTIELWKKLNKWAIEGFNETFKKFNLTFKKTYKESNIYKKGTQEVKKALKNNLFIKDEDNNTLAELEKYNLPNKILLRSDGTAIYMTQDIALAQEKHKDYKMDESIILTGTEQNLHFKQLFKILEILGYKFNNIHIGYGMVNLPEGKMKSREGTVVDADDLIQEMEEIAKNELLKRDKTIPKKELKTKMHAIGLAAIRLYLLRTDTVKDMIYNPKESISFDGETGPYLQYTYARANSILKKETKPKNIDYKLLTHKKEQELLNHLRIFNNKIEEAASHYKPSLLARYTIELSQLFNEFYQACPVIKAEEKLKQARLKLVETTKQALEICLKLLEIEPLPKM